MFSNNNFQFLNTYIKRTPNHEDKNNKLERSNLGGGAGGGGGGNNWNRALEVFGWVFKFLLIFSLGLDLSPKLATRCTVAMEGLTTLGLHLSFPCFMKAILVLPSWPLTRMVLLFLVTSILFLRLCVSIFDFWVFFYGTWVLHTRVPLNFHRNRVRNTRVATVNSSLKDSRC